MIPLEDRCYLCPLCDQVCHGVEAAAAHASAQHADATELTYLDLDDPKHMPDEPGQAY